MELSTKGNIGNIAKRDETGVHQISGIDGYNKPLEGK